MLVGTRLRQLREQKGLSQADIEKKTRLMRGYISRVENGHVVPSLDTLEKFAEALDLPFHHLFVDGNGEPSEQKVTPSIRLEDLASKEDRSPTETSFLWKMSRLSNSLGDSDRRVLLALAEKMVANAA